VQQVLDRAARRLLAEELNRDALHAPTGLDGHPFDGGPDDRAALVDGQSRPVRPRVDGDRGARAA